MPLQVVESQRLYRQIAEQLRGLIAQGEFPTGTRLPAERDLARQLGVSRPSVREALIALEVEGRVEVRVGSGVYVREGQKHLNGHSTIPATEWGPLELLRARRVIEGEIASMAALEGKRKQVDAIGAAIASMHQDADAGIQPRAGDRAFHVAVALAAGNVVLLETVQTFWDARRGPLFEKLGDHFESVPSWRKAIAEHELVYQAIRAHDGTAARDAMRQHLDKAHARFSASWRRANSS
jgi:DNA-binding FadR family transcriptional regulator